MKYTFVKQHDITDCAAACMAMVCLHYKKETTITRLRDVMGTDIKGTNLIGLSKCAEELGFASTKKLFAYALLASLIVTLLGILSSVFNNIIYDVS